MDTFLLFSSNDIAIMFSGPLTACSQIYIYQKCTLKQKHLKKVVMTPKRPVPMCSRCKNHGQYNRIKSHKFYCPFLNCCCIKCAVLKERQRVMAKQIYIRRKQQEVENSSPTITSPNLSKNNPININDDPNSYLQQIINSQNNTQVSNNYNRIKRAANILQKLFPHINCSVFEQLLIQFNFDIITLLEFITNNNRNLTYPFL